tara:strand:+ start:154 stop:780 length:627 start_codon:yes stop_codon:yes gene_type:complete
MSKKTLLEEGTVRQFMKLANLKPLTSNFINETYMDEDLYEAEHEGAEDEMLPPEPEDAEMDAMADEEVPMDMDMDAEEGAEGALAGVSEEAVEELISVVADALAGATGVDIDVTGGEEGMEGEEEMDDMDFAPAEEAPEGEEGEEEVMEMAHPMEEDEYMEGIDMVDTDAVMQETYRRVAKRLGAMNKQHKLVESVTNRIMSRLNKSK